MCPVQILQYLDFINILHERASAIDPNSTKELQRLKANTKDLVVWPSNTTKAALRRVLSYVGQAKRARAAQWDARFEGLNMGTPSEATAAEEAGAAAHAALTLGCAEEHDVVLGASPGLWWLLAAAGVAVAGPAMLYQYSMVSVCTHAHQLE